MTIILENLSLPEKGPVEIKVNVSFEIKVTAEEARRKVNRWLIDHVSILMGGLQPTLIWTGKQAVWRVPVHLTFPHTGSVGTVGEVEVEVEMGELQNLEARKAEIERCARELAARVPPYKPHDHVPPEYLAKNVPPAQKIVEEETQPVSAKE